MSISKERFSFYIGIGSIIPWVIIIFFYLMKGVQAIVEVGFFKYGLIAILLFQFVGLFFGAVGCLRRSTERKHAIWGLILNVPSLLVILILLIAPFIMTKVSYLPSTQEIATKYPEFLVEARNIEGIESF